MITLDDEIREVEREIGQRQRAYARLVAERRMFQSDADRQIAVMRAVLERLKGAKVRREPVLVGRQAVYG